MSKIRSPNLKMFWCQIHPFWTRADCVPIARRRHNEDFTVMLKWKLRLPLWPEQRYRCNFGKINWCVWGPRFVLRIPLQNTYEHNGIHELLQDTCQVGKLISNQAMIDKEPKGLVTPLPSVLLPLWHLNHVWPHARWNRLASSLEPPWLWCHLCYFLT